MRLVTFKSKSDLNILNFTILMQRQETFKGVKTAEKNEGILTFPMMLPTS